MPSIFLLFNNAVFWNVTLYGFCKNRRFGETYHLRLLVTANVSISLILVTMMMERHVSQKRRFLQEAYGFISQKTVFFIVGEVKTPNLTAHRTVLLTEVHYCQYCLN
jgi:hypothetical protein